MYASHTHEADGETRSLTGIPFASDNRNGISVPFAAKSGRSAAIDTTQRRLQRCEPTRQTASGRRASIMTTAVVMGAITAKACVLLVRDDLVLVQHSLDGSLYRRPGGTVEFGETASETARRELLEEYHLSAQVGELVITWKTSMTRQAASGTR